MLMGPTSKVDIATVVDIVARSVSPSSVTGPVNTAGAEVSFTVSTPDTVRSWDSPSTIVLGSPSTEMSSKVATGYFRDSRKSRRMRLSRRFESDSNISTLIATAPTRLAAGSSRLSAMSPATATVVPVASRLEPPSRSCTL